MREWNDVAVGMRTAGQEEGRLHDISEVSAGPRFCNFCVIYPIQYLQGPSEKLRIESVFTCLKLQN